jgi:hypothetical protein
VLPNEVKQGWGRLPHGHCIVAHSQANTHDENTAVNVYFQMPFSTTLDKAVLLQQVACTYLLSSSFPICFCTIAFLHDSLTRRLQTAQLAVFSAIARQKCFETLRTVCR